MAGTIVNSRNNPTNTAKEFDDAIQNTKNDHPKIIYIVGDGRCGSTILDRFLGAASGGLSLNELHELPRFGFIEKRKCACGEVFPECDFWRTTAERLNLKLEDTERLAQSQKTYESTKRFRKTKRELGMRDRPIEMTQYLHFLQTLFTSLAESQDARVMVDSSKLPTRALLLDACPNSTIYVVHVVRHPCAIVNSWRKTKFDPGRGDAMENHGLLRTVAFWWARNHIGSLLRKRLPYKLVRYESFVAKPMNTAADVMTMLDEPLVQVAQSKEGYVLPPIHTISGNPDRFKSGCIKLELDERWRRELPLAHQAIVRLLTLPMLTKYGYR